jgi:hypothetical protein
MDAKLLLNQKNYILKNKKITDTEIDEIKESFRSRMQDNMEDQLREEQTNNVGATEEHLLLENRNLGEDTQQHVAREKLKEELEIMWHKVRLLQMSERQRLPNLIENNKIIRLKKEINGIIEEILKENETDITDLNRLIYAAETVITEKVIKPGKTVKSRQNKNSWKIRIQKQISNWRKELSILVESGPGPDNFKLNIKKEKFFSEIQINRPQRSSTTDRKLKAENTGKGPTKQKI